MEERRNEILKELKSYRSEQRIRLLRGNDKK